MKVRGEIMPISRQQLEESKKGKHRPPSRMDIVLFIKEQKDYEHNMDMITEKFLGYKLDPKKHPELYTFIQKRQWEARNYIDDNEVGHWEEVRPLTGGFYVKRIFTE